MTGCTMKMRCFKILLGRTLRNTLILMAICMSLLNMMNWVYYTYSEALIETYNKYSPPTGAIFLTRLSSISSTPKSISKHQTPTVIPKSFERRYPFFDPGASYDDSGIYMEVGPPLDTKDVHKKKLNF